VVSKDRERPQLAALRPVDNDGVLAVGVGTALWLVALIVLALLHQQLADAGRSWWIAVAAVGLGLGLLGLVYCTRRRNRLRKP